MKGQDLKAMTNEELALAERNTTEELWRLRFQQHTGQLTNTSLLKNKKRNLARIMTISRERAVGISNAPGEG
jgi:large subunit ribosomal protein L29